MQKKFDMLIKHFIAPTGYELLDYLNPVMYLKSRTGKHAIKLVYKMSSRDESNMLETDSIDKALAAYKILSWYIAQKTNVEMKDELDFLSTKEIIDKKETGW